jgi:hypothetical protein
VFTGTLIRRMTGALLTCVLAATTLPACTPASDGLPAGVEVTLLQLRSDVADRQAQVRVRNGSDQPFTVGEVSVTDPRFEKPAIRVVDRTTTLAPGASVDVRIQLGPVDCARSDDADATLTLRYTTAGTEHTGTTTIHEQFPFLAALHTAGCLQERIGDVANVSFGAFTPSAAGVPAGLDVTLTPNGSSGDTPRLIRIHETNLLRFAADAGSFPIDLSGTTAPQTVTLPLVPARCDPHAVQEDKRGTVFRVDVALDGTDGSFDLAASPELRAALLTWVAGWCGYGAAPAK